MGGVGWRKSEMEPLSTSFSSSPCVLLLPVLNFTAEMNIQWLNFGKWYNLDTTSRGKKSSSKIKDGLSFFNLTSHLIYFSHADTRRRKWILCIYATRGLLHEYRDVAALCAVKRGAHWTQSRAHRQKPSLHDGGSLSCSNSAPSRSIRSCYSACDRPRGLWLRQNLGLCRVPTNEEETVNLWPHKLRVFLCLWHNVVSLSSTNCVSPSPGETAVVCNVNEALPGCVNGFI